MNVETTINPPWIVAHVHRCELEAIGAAILDRRALEGAQFGRLKAGRFDSPEAKALKMVMDIDPTATDAALFRAARRIATVWQPTEICTAATTALAWHSEYYAHRLMKAWKLRDAQRRALRTILEIANSEGLYRWS